MAANIKVSDIYKRAYADPKYQRDNHVFMIIRRHVNEKRMTRRHGMALWNLQQIEPDVFTAERLFENSTDVKSAYPIMTETEACDEMDRRGYVWVDPFFEGGEYFGQGYTDRWERKSEMVR